MKNIMITYKRLYLNALDCVIKFNIYQLEFVFKGMMPCMINKSVLYI
jgi:hypothetical protein